MKVSGSVLAVALALFLAGCMTESDVASGDGEEPTVEQYRDDRIEIKNTDEGNREWTPTLDQPPQWVRGLYWNIEVHSDFDGRVFDAQRVVAGAEGNDTWLVGMPTHDFSNELMVLHIPGFGQIKQDTLGFEAHDVWFEPVTFPLTEDTSWSTAFQADGAVEDCTVESIEGLKANIVCTGQYAMDIVYDAEMRAVSKIDVHGYGGYEVTDWGFDWHHEYPEWENLVTVPHMSDLIFFHGRLAGVGEIAPSVALVPPNPAPPMGTVEIDSTYDRVSFSLILGDIVTGGQVPVAPGYFMIDAVAPDGEQYTDELSPADGVPLQLTSYKHDKPGGEWSLTYVAGGGGVSFIEGIGYHVYDVDVSSGRILPSVGEHQHGSEGGH